MNLKSITAAVVGIAFVAANLITNPASALSPASMSLSGASNTNGNFVVTVYENTGTDTVTTVNLALDFSSPVSNVSYDYSVGPFKGATPSGAHYVTGEVSGTQAVANVSFTVTTPSTVTATVSPSSFLKHAVRDSSGTVTGATENFAISRGSAAFTYGQPGRGNQPAPTTPATPKPVSPVAGNKSQASPSTTANSGLAVTNNASESTPTDTTTPSTNSDQNTTKTANDTDTSSTTARENKAASKSGNLWKVILPLGIIALGAAALYLLITERRGTTTTITSPIAAASAATLNQKTASTKTTKKARK